METAPRDFDALLAHAGWARALARNLVRDPDRADDLVQRAWLAALRRPPADGTPPRRWLAAVLRNFVRADARSIAHDGDAIDDAATQVVRLVAAVRELDEPYRSTVWARYYDGLAPREIAQRDGVPVDTVKTRLARALALLRARFDREHGGNRGAWIAALVPLADVRPEIALSTGVFVMQTKWKLAIAAALILCGVGAWIATGADEHALSSAQVAVVDVAAGSVRAADPSTLAEDARDLDERALVPAAPVVTTVALPSQPMVRGRVLDLERRPVADLEVGAADRRIESSSVRSAADGSFEIAAERAGSALEARGPGWATVWVDRHEPLRARESLTILVAPAGRIAGVVLDHEGRPAARAFVWTSVSADGRRALSDLIDTDPHEIGHTAFTDDAGRFDLGLVPLVRGTIGAVRDDRKSGEIAIPRDARDDLELKLGGADVEGVVLRGRVIDAQGVVAGDAVVALAHVVTKTKPDGTFELCVVPSRLSDLRYELVAARLGSLPARVAIGTRDDVERAAGRVFELVLGGAPLVVTGRVVDSDGQPVAGARLSVGEQESIGSRTIEWGGSPVLASATLEGIARGGTWGTIAPTGEDGSFTLDGLQDRAYDVRVVSVARTAGRVVRGVAAGTRDLRIELDTHGPTTRVAGHVVDGLGRGVASAQVSADLELPDLDQEITSRATFTDETGAFELAGVRGRVLAVTANLTARGIGARVEPQAGDALDDVRLTILRMVAIQIDTTAEPALATQFEIVDARRGRRSLNTAQSVVVGGQAQVSRTSMTAAPIVDGRSDVVTVLEGDLTAVLFREDVEVRRIPIVLRAEGLTVVRP